MQTSAVHDTHCLRQAHAPGAHLAKNTCRPDSKNTPLTPKVYFCKKYDFEIVFLQINTLVWATPEL
jgi:hypothetical protein